MKRTVTTDFTQGPVFRQLLWFAVPFMLSNLLQLLYTTVDAMVVGRFVGSAGLAGVSIGGSLAEIVTHVVMSFATAGQVLISQYIGAGNKHRMEKTVGTMMKLIGIASLAMMALYGVCWPYFLRWMQTPTEAFGSAKVYLLVSVLGFPFICGYNGLCAVLRAAGDSKRPFYVIAASAMTNVVLDLLFVVGFQWGAAGAALATVMSQLVSVALSFVVLHRNRVSLGLVLDRSMFRRDREITALIMKQAIPLSIKSVALSGSSLFVSSWINSYGVQAVAAVTVGRKATMFNSVTSQGLMNAGTSMIGQNIGGRRFERVRKIVVINGLLSLCTFVIYSAVYILFIDDLFLLFTTDAEVLAYARVFLPAMIVGLASNSLMIPFFTLVMGSGFARFNLAVSVFDGIVLRVGLSVLLGAVCGFGVEGFYWGDNLAALGTAIPSTIFYFSGVWCRRILIGEEKPETA